jgi:hypothetical protein
MYSGERELGLGLALDKLRCLRLMADAGRSKPCEGRPGSVAKPEAS